MKKTNSNVDVYIYRSIYSQQPQTACVSAFAKTETRLSLICCTGEPEHGDFQLFRESVKGGGGLTNESGASEYIFLSFSVFQEAPLSGLEFNTAIKRFDGPTAFKDSLLCDTLS